MKTGALVDMVSSRTNEGKRDCTHKWELSLRIVTPQPRKTPPPKVKRKEEEGEDPNGLFGGEFQEFKLMSSNLNGVETRRDAVRVSASGGY